MSHFPTCLPEVYKSVRFLSWSCLSTKFLRVCKYWKWNLYVNDELHCIFNIQLDSFQFLLILLQISLNSISAHFKSESIVLFIWRAELFFHLLIIMEGLSCSYLSNTGFDETWMILALIFEISREMFGGKDLF